MKDKQREKFESWTRTHLLNLDIIKDTQSYASMMTQLCWLAYQKGFQEAKEQLPKSSYLEGCAYCWVYTGKEWEIATLLGWSTSTYDGNTLPVAIICLDSTKRVTHVSVDLISFSNTNPGGS